MKKFLCFLCTLMLFLAGCQTAQEDPVLKRQTEQRKKLRQDLDRIQYLISHQKTDAAELLFDTVKKTDLKAIKAEYFQQEISQLENVLEKQRTLFSHQAEKNSTYNQMINEVDTKFTLPETYNAIIDEQAPVEDRFMAPAKLEPLLQWKIPDFVGTDLTLNEILITLSQKATQQKIHLNFIADEALSDPGKRLTFSVKNVPLQEILQYISRNMGIAFNIGENVIWVTKTAKTSSGPALVTRIIRLHSGSVPAGDFKNAQFKDDSSGSTSVNSDTSSLPKQEDLELQTALDMLIKNSPDGANYKLFPDRNILLIQTSRENIRIAEQIVKEFDRSPLQVVIEARFMTVGRDDLRDIGVDIMQKNSSEVKEYSASAGSGSIKVSDALSAFGMQTTSAGILASDAQGGGVLSLNGVLDNRTYQVVINAMEKKESTSDLSAPKVTVLNNRQARFRMGKTVNYYDEYSIETVDNGDLGHSNVLVPDGDPKTLEMGMVFDVKVNVGNDKKTILLNLLPKIRTNLEWEYFSGSSEETEDTATTARLPKFDEQYVATSVAIQSGQTVVLGGMLGETVKKEVRQVPFLGDIPVLGWFFRRTINTRVPQNLLIFVTATVISSDGSYINVTQPEKKQTPATKK